jgi:hypothetical protein
MRKKRRRIGRRRKEEEWLQTNFKVLQQQKTSSPH